MENYFTLFTKKELEDNTIVSLKSSRPIPKDPSYRNGLEKTFTFKWNGEIRTIIYW